jgi:hypothetical protein
MNQEPSHQPSKGKSNYTKACSKCPKGCRPGGTLQYSTTKELKKTMKRWKKLKKDDKQKESKYSISWIITGNDALGNDVIGLDNTMGKPFRDYPSLPFYIDLDGSEAEEDAIADDE